MKVSPRCHGKEEAARRGGLAPAGVEGGVAAWGPMKGCAGSCMLSEKQTAKQKPWRRGPHVRTGVQEAEKGASHLPYQLPGLLPDT